MERIQISAVSVQSTERFTKRVCFNLPEVLVFVLTFTPGQELPSHRHPRSSVVLNVTAGTGHVIVDGREEPVAPGDVLLVKSEEELGIRNTGNDPLIVLVSLSPNPTNPAYARELG